MVASTVKSDMVTNAEAVPVSLAGVDMGGRVRAFIEVVEVATTSLDEIGDKIHVLRVPAKFVPLRLTIKNDDLDGNASPALAVDVGLHRADTGAVVDVDAFATAITTLQAANVPGVDVITEAMNIDKIGKTLWEIGGLSTDPGVDLLVSLTVTAAAATAAAGTVVMVMEGVMAE